MFHMKLSLLLLLAYRAKGDLNATLSKLVGVQVEKLESKQRWVAFASPVDMIPYMAETAVGELLAQEENITTTAASVITTTAVDIGPPLKARRHLENGLDVFVNARRNDNKIKKEKKGRSTSSSSGSKEKSSDGVSSGSSADESLEISSDLSTSSSQNKQKKYERHSTAERTGWRKWHRKCHPCPEDMAMKWKDPNVKWICGAYQRAQRSFKSLCMMHYRNCQDGTMFTKIHEHRCKNDSEREGKPHGDHFFYTYKALLSGDSSTSVSTSTESSDSDESNIYDDAEF